MIAKWKAEAKKELEEQLWIVDYKRRTSRRKSYVLKIFGLFDIIAFRAGDPIKFIAVFGRCGVYKKDRRAIKNFLLPLESCQKEIWHYDPNRKSGLLKKELIKNW